MKNAIWALWSLRKWKGWSWKIRLRIWRKFWFGSMLERLEAREEYISKTSPEISNPRRLAMWQELQRSSYK